MREDLLERILAKDYVEDASPYVPESSPPTTPFASKIALVVFIVGVISGFFYGLEYFLIGLTTCVFILMIDSSRQLNYRLRTQGKAEADYVAGLAAGGLIVFINVSIITFFLIDMSFPINLLIATLVASIYEYILMILLRVKVETPQIHVQKHPKRPMDRYYIFDDETYISLVEEVALEKAPSN